MSERLVQEIPNDEMLAETYDGLTLDEFRALSDEAVDSLRAARLAEVSGSIQDQLDHPEVKQSDDEIFDSINKTLTLDRFMQWRQHGIPDREITEGEMTGYMQDLVRSRVADNPDYGDITEQYTQLTEDDRQLIQGLFHYFTHARDPYEYLSVTDATLEDTLGLEAADTEALVRNQVIEPIGESFQGGHYQLQGDYYDHWLRQHYGAA